MTRTSDSDGPRTRKLEMPVTGNRVPGHIFELCSINVVMMLSPSRTSVKRCREWKEIYDPSGTSPERVALPPA